MRAFLTGSNVDIDPASEAAVRLVLDQIVANPGTTLSQFTLSELSDIAGAVNQLATVNQLAAGLNIESTVMTIKNAVSSDAVVHRVYDGGGSCRQTTVGPGAHRKLFSTRRRAELGFPEALNSETGNPTVNFNNSLMVQRTKPVGAVTTTVVVEANPLNSGDKKEENYYFKDSRGILNYGNNDNTDTLTPRSSSLIGISYSLSMSR